MLQGNNTNRKITFKGELEINFQDLLDQEDCKLLR
jgi:hypothetical protein